MKDLVDLAVVRTVQGELSGELIRSRLESEGIPCMLRFETYFNMYVGIFTPVSIIVSCKYL